MPDTRATQARLAALGFNPGPIDGLDGRRTQGALSEALAALGKSSAAELFHPSGLSRIHWHWTAGAEGVIDLEREHYHFIIGAKGEVVEGLHAPERNGDPSAGDYAAHTLNANTGAIGISIDAMAGAQERPFHWGSQPMTWRQIEALAQLTAVLSDRFWIPVSRYSTLSHSEVQPTLGIRQRWKWDINVLPDMAAPGDPLEVGDRIREMVREHMSGQPAEPTEPVAPEPTPEIPAGMARKAAAFDRIASIVNDT